MYIICRHQSIFLLTILLIIGQIFCSGLLDTIETRNLETILPRAPVSVMSNSFDDILPKDKVFTCYVEYQVTKRRPGQCIQLGQNTRGCVAGSFIDPFNPDCL